MHREPNTSARSTEHLCLLQRYTEDNRGRGQWLLFGHTVPGCADVPLSRQRSHGVERNRENIALWMATSPKRRDLYSPHGASIQKGQCSADTTLRTRKCSIIG
jgi:hypothetical protein